MKKIDFIPLSINANSLKIPCNVIAISEEGAKEFNEILSKIREMPNISIIRRTKSGGISSKVEDFFPPMFDVRCVKSCVEITFIGQIMYRIQFRRPLETEDDRGISGQASFRKFKDDLQKYGINIENYKIENGEEVKKQIPRAKIELANESYRDITFDAHHLDIHSAHMAGVATAFPEFYPIINHYFKNRKDPRVKAVYKSILTHTWGYLQSKMVGYKYSHIAKAGIEFTNKKVNELSEMLTSAGRVPLLYNTDGFWYAGPVFHGPGEGKELGKWENDHVNCKFRAKSAGVYEYEENGKYHPVVRGHTALDKIKPRELWEWGDIYNYSSITGFGVDEEYYIVNLETGERF